MIEQKRHPMTWFSRRWPSMRTLLAMRLPFSPDPRTTDHAAPQQKFPPHASRARRHGSQIAPAGAGASVSPCIDPVAEVTSIAWPPPTARRGSRPDSVGNYDRGVEAASDRNRRASSAMRARRHDVFAPRCEIGEFWVCHSESNSLPVRLAGSPCSVHDGHGKRFALALNCEQ